MPLSKVPADALALGAARSNFGAGAVLQVVSATKVNAFSTSSTSPVDVTGLSVSITPTSSTSKMLVVVQLFCGSDVNSATYANIVRNSTPLNVSTAGGSFNSSAGMYLGSSNLYLTLPLTFLDSPNTASATTYKVQIFAGTSTGAVGINRRISDLVIGGASTITVMEIAA